MRTVHVLRKYDTSEWGGTESAVSRLLDGLGGHGVESVVYCPRTSQQTAHRLPSHERCQFKYYKAHVPVWGLTTQERRQFVAVGGNLLSFDLMPALWSERDADLIHSHTLGRLGAIAAAVARRRHVPFVVTIHGGFLDLPEPLAEEFHKPSSRGFDWGRMFGMLLGSRQLLERADAILTCNPTEAALLREKFPNTRVEVQPHGIPAAAYQADAREAAWEAWPKLRQQRVLLCVGRIDPVKNQHWLVEEARQVLSRHPESMLVFAGPVTDQDYEDDLLKMVEDLRCGERILFTGGLASGDARLIGLFQIADVVLLSSISETFGIVLLEAWAAGTAVISSRTSGAAALVDHGENGWLFDLDTPATFHEALDEALENPDSRNRAARAGNAKVLANYDVPTIARRTQQLYYQLIESKSCTT